MNIFSTALVGVLAGALIAGCGSVPQRTGKGNDHVVAYRTQAEEPKVVKEREIVYVERNPVYYQPVYYQPVVPAYRVVTSDPAYTTVTTRPVYRTYVPVTRTYYTD